MGQLSKIVYSTAIGNSLDMDVHTCPHCRGIVRPLPPEAQAALEEHFAKPFMLHERIVWCSCEEKRREELAWKWANVNLPRNAKTFENLDDPPRGGTEEAIAAVKELVSGEASFHVLTLQGVTGSGKSHIAEAGLRLAWDKGIWKIRYDKVSRFLGRIRVAGYDEKELLLKQYIWKDLLVLDDLGEENVTDWTIETLTDVVDERIREGMKTIITTNLFREDLDNSRSFRVGDRIFDDNTGDVRVVTLTCDSYRIRKR